MKVKLPLPRGATATVFDRGDHLELASLVVHEDLRNRGIGTQAVRRIMGLNRRIRLEAVPYDGCRRKLHRFYKRLGFAASRRGRRTFFEWNPNV